MLERAEYSPTCNHKDTTRNGYPPFTDASSCKTDVHSFASDENYKNGFYVNSAAFITDNVLTLNTTHDPNLTPLAPPPQGPACSVPSRCPGNLRFQVPTSNRAAPFFTFLHLTAVLMGRRITGQGRQTQTRGLTSNEGMCRTRGSHSKPRCHATHEHRSGHPEPLVGAPPNQRQVPGHAQGGPTGHTGQRGLQSEWQVNAVQL